MKSTQLYDFTLSANGSQVILADANFYKVLTSTGDLQITRDGGSTVKPMRAGRGEREVPFQRLTIRDISGATNSGTIVVGDSNFIDDTIILSSAINVRPEVASGSYKANGLLSANTAEQIFAPASNVNGAIILSAGWVCTLGTVTYPISAIIAKNAAPTTSIDGEVIATTINAWLGGTFGFENGQLPKEQYVAAGLGLYFFSQTGASAGYPRHCRYKLL